MRAVILAAGRGSRLQRITASLPKCLAEVGGCSLIERQIRTLNACGVSDILVVTGHQAADVRRTCGARASFVHNDRFASTNSLYSLWLARRALTRGFVVLNCDVLFHPQLLVDLLTCRYDDALLACSCPPEGGYSSEEMKLRIRSGCVVEISKTIRAEDADGENVGIARFSPRGAALLVEEMTEYVSNGLTGEWLPAAFDRSCRRRPLHVVDNRGFPWIEIDCPDDYRRACAEILPAIDGRIGGHRPARRLEHTDIEAAAAGSF
jgi:choline kinase